MEPSLEIAIWTVVIFFARVVDVGLGTIRVQLIVRQKKLPSAIAGFAEVLIYILIISRVIRDFEQWTYLLAYATGFAAGTLLGMVLTEKLSRRSVHATVITRAQGTELELAIREAGFALTRHNGTGRDGPVDVMEVVCPSKELRRLVGAVTAADAGALFFTQELAGVHGGYLYGVKGKI